MPGLDLLRALAVLWVMMTHTYLTGLFPDGNLVADSGWMGVDLFFALSGFLIGGQLFRPYVRNEPEHIGLFYFRRLFRTLPPYLVVVALYFTVPFFRERPTLAPLWQYLTFTENLFVAFPRGGFAFSHAWSLCVEEQFYLFMPLLVWLLMRRPALWKAATVFAVVVVGGMLLRAGLWLHEVAPVWANDDGPRSTPQFMERIYYPTWCRLDGLTGGVIVAAVRAFKPKLWEALGRRANLFLAAGAAVVGVCIWLFHDQRAFWPSVVGYPLLSLGMASLVFAGANANSLIGRWRIPGAGAIAAMAYSLYLTHKETYHMVHVLWGDALAKDGPLAFAVYAGAAFAVGALLYVTFERPALILRDRILKRSAMAQPKIAAARAW
jgi:peptidoglycan/LPS O-acetylase OafA/YrhL